MSCANCRMQFGCDLERPCVNYFLGADEDEDEDDFEDDGNDEDCDETKMCKDGGAL